MWIIFRNYYVCVGITVKYVAFLGDWGFKKI